MQEHLRLWLSSAGELEGHGSVVQESLRLWLSSAGELEGHGSVVQEIFRAMAQ